ncbi:EamA/RhaT family transporter [Kocuria tytonicola]|nr:EamA/RhaT family transporter [Kocuria tytonicola]
MSTAPCGPRSTSRTPTAASISRSMRDAVGWVVPSARAAPDNDGAAASAANIRTCRSSRVMRPAYSGAHGEVFPGRSRRGTLDRPPPPTPGGTAVTGPRNTVALGLFLLLWSSGAVATALGLTRLDPAVFLLLRAVVTAGIAWLLWAFVRSPLPRTRGQWGAVLVTGLLMHVLYQGLFFGSLAAGIAPGLLSLVVACQPLLTAVVTGQRGLLAWAGILLGLGGLVLACSPEFSGADSTLGGVVAAAGALLALTAATLVQARSTRVGVLANLALQSTTAVPVFLLAALVLRPALPPLAPATIGPVLWMGAVVGVAATGLLYWLVRRVDVVTVTSVQFLVPAVTAVLDWMVRGQSLHGVTLAGMAVVICALFVFERGRRRRGAATGAPRTGRDPAAGSATHRASRPSQSL